MSIQGYKDYQRREYCKDIGCLIQQLLEGQDEGSDEYEIIRGVCKVNCIHSTYEFHHWLMGKGYLLVRPE